MRKLLWVAVFLGLVSSTAGVAKAEDKVAVAASKCLVLYNGYGVDVYTVEHDFDKDRDVSAWKKILSTVIDTKSGDSNALLIDVSAVTGIFTANANLTYDNNFTLLLDAAKIQIGVQVDGQWVTPGLVTYDSFIRFNASANTAPFFTLDLSAQTAAHSFGFYQVGLTKTKKNDHTVEVFARICIDADTFATYGLAATDVAAFIASRTLTVETAKVDLDETNK